MLVAFLTTTLIGYATWHGFEKRLMARRGWLRRLRRGPVAYEQ
jgi:hypothetical protein